MRLTHVVIISALPALMLMGGCAKNVERINFTKWGHSYETQGSSMDPTAQGGVSTIVGNSVPQNGIHAAPKASAGGAYRRSFSSSPSYRMVGGFHPGNR